VGYTITVYFSKTLWTKLPKIVTLRRDSWYFLYQNETINTAGIVFAHHFVARLQKWCFKAVESLCTKSANCCAASDFFQSGFVSWANAGQLYSANASIGVSVVRNLFADSASNDAVKHFTV